MNDADAPAAGELRERLDRVAHWLRERAFTGLTWKAVALIALVCLLNALRRNVGYFDQTFGELVRHFGFTFLTGFIVVPPATLLPIAAFNLAPPRSVWRYAAALVTLVVVSFVATVLLQLVEVDDARAFLAQGWLKHRKWIYGTWPRYATIGGLLTIVYVFFRIRQESEAETQRAELDRARLAEQMEQARLQVLQAQIEPHFLFNTLANVRSLYQTDAVAAASMLDHLMRYLAVALPQMRASESTLGREATLTESFLAIQKTRMGRRLAFELDIPPSLRDASVPPMMMLTLVENSIKHGLNPLPEGGFIRVSARVEEGLLVTEVADTGQGFTKSSGGGTGLANTRSRLAAMYGNRAELTLAMNVPRGVTATIVQPYLVAASTPAAA